MSYQVLNHHYLDEVAQRSEYLLSFGESGAEAEDPNVVPNRKVMPRAGVIDRRVISLCLVNSYTGWDQQPHLIP
jgi:hypothetical protein